MRTSDEQGYFIRTDANVRELLRSLNRIERIVNNFHLVGESIMATLADVQAAVARERTVEDSIVVLLGQIAQQLKDAIASADPVAMQAVVDQLDANAKTLADAVAANTILLPTPPAPTP